MTPGESTTLRILKSVIKGRFGRAPVAVGPLRIPIKVVRGAAEYWILILVVRGC